MSAQDSVVGVGHVGETWENLTLHHRKNLVADQRDRVLEPGELATLEGQVREVKDLTEEQEAIQADIDHRTANNSEVKSSQDTKNGISDTSDNATKKPRLLSEPDDETKANLVKSLVQGALDTLEGEHSSKLRTASINAVLTAMYTHTESTLALLDEKIGLKYFLDEWLGESDYTELGWPDRKVWVLGLIALIRSPSPRHKAISDISDRIMTTALDILMEKLHETGGIDSETDTADSDDEFMDCGPERFLKGSGSNIHHRTTSLEYRALQVEKAANDIIEKAKQIKDDALELMKSDVDSKAKTEASAESTTQGSKWISSSKESVETLTHSETGEHVKMLDLPKEPGLPVIKENEPSDPIHQPSESEDPMASDSDSYSSDEDDSTFDADDSSFEEDPELMQYYFALQDANICSCCLPPKLIEALRECKDNDIDWYIRLTSNLSTDAKNDMEVMSQYALERDTELGKLEDLEAEHVSNTALAKAVEDVKKETDEDAKKETDETTTDTNTATPDRRSLRGSCSRHSSTSSVSSYGTDDSMVIHSPAAAIYAVTKYFKHLKMN